ncbi:gamma-tubulin complex component 3 [Planoprotostelium fungivorum]|uniref:Gamma-tubulin complex component 3 n=1 Tax=Planoprotostelium fungivorum TaxID=1890364 RepID=A0A2P6NSQ9_9EUKA|nr:gamma-tubulin complex component 3 [Planoprotostelium fungivorum]
MQPVFNGYWWQNSRAQSFDPKVSRARRVIESAAMSSQRMDGSATAKLLLQLVQLELGPSLTKDDESQKKINSVFQRCIRILNVNIKPMYDEDEDSVSQWIQKRMLREKGAKSVSPFIDALTRLRSTPAKNISYILRLLESISQASTQQISIPQDRAFYLRNMDKGETDPIHKRMNQIDKSKPSIPNDKRQRESPNQVSEAVLARDLLFVIQGIDGTYIKYRESENAYSAETRCTTPVRESISRISEMGFLYRQIRKFLHISSQNRYEEVSGSGGCVGLVGQSFCSAMEDELNDYSRMIASLSIEIGKRQDYGLTRLLVWMSAPMQRLSLLGEFVYNASGKKGGALVSSLLPYCSHGDPFTSELAVKIVAKMCKPLFDMIWIWISQGELRDPFGEFFVSSDREVQVDHERVWYDKYKIRKDMLPSFISLELAKKIFNVGKSINFLQQCCGDSEWLQRLHRGHRVELEYSSSTERELHDLVDLSGDDIHKRVIQFKFREHCWAIKRYLLLGQGDFIQYLMDLLEPELDGPASMLSRLNLGGKLGQATRASNLQEDSPDFVKDLDIKLNLPDKSSGGVSGWDHFSLDFRVKKPVNTILTTSAMASYVNAFRFLWRIKRVEHSLSTLKKQARRPLYTTHFLRNEMVHFIHNLQYYIMFEVLEVSWQDFEKDMKSARNLDELIVAHQKYLSTIEQKALLAETNNNLELLRRLDALLNNILRFCQLQDQLYKFLEQEDSKKRSSSLKSQKKKQEPATNKVVVDEGLTEELILISEQYQRNLKSFTSLLGNQPTEQLRYFTYRLDFNEYYEKKDRKNVGPSEGLMRINDLGHPTTDDEKEETIQQAIEYQRRQCRLWRHGWRMMAMMTVDDSQLLDTELATYNQIKNKELIVPVSDSIVTVRGELYSVFIDLQFKLCGVFADAFYDNALRRGDRIEEPSLIVQTFVKRDHKTCTSEETPSHVAIES